MISFAPNGKLEEHFLKQNSKSWTFYNNHTAIPLSQAQDFGLVRVYRKKQTAVNVDMYTHIHAQIHTQSWAEAVKICAGLI